MHVTSFRFNHPAGKLAHLALALCTAWVAAPAWAAPDGVSTGACTVLTAGILKSTDYLYRYEGGCKNGLAEGQGTASWALRHAPDAPATVWKGRFSQGVFLADKQSVGAKRLDSSRVLLDVGNLPAPKGGQAGRLWVESRADDKLPPSVCKTNGLQVSANGDLADDALAKAWLDKAYEQWVAMCPLSAGVPKANFLRISLQSGADWSPDANGNIPSGVAQATKSFSKQPPEWQSYRNEAAQKLAQQQQIQQDTKELQGNRDRIQAFAQKSGASQLVSLDALEKNPFRFDKQVILVAIRMGAARTPIEAVVQSAKRYRGDWSTVLLRGAIADWDEQGRIAAVRVKGRSTDKETKGSVILELVDSQRCKTADCEDYLLMPGKRWLQDESFSASLQPPHLHPPQQLALR